MMIHDNSVFLMRSVEVLNQYSPPTQEGAIMDIPQYHFCETD